MGEHAQGDAVIAALAGFGAAEPLRTDDVLRAEGTLRAFHGARRRRVRTRAVWMSGAAAIAATLLVGWWTLPRLQGVQVEVSEGAFELQQDRLAAGERVPTGEWIEITEGRACLRIEARRACGEPGTRMRIVDGGAIELERGRVRLDGGFALTTPLGELRSDGELDIELVPESGTLTVHEGSATFEGGGTTNTLGLGAHSLVARDAEVVASLPTPTPPRGAAAPSEAPELDVDEPVITDGDAPPQLGHVSRKPSARDAVRPPQPSAGEMLTAARALASAGKLESAARAYQKLVDAHPASSEARAGLVSLGRVQASRGKSSAALAAFSAYLKGGGGALSEEAQWGRITALHALGRTAQRDAAIDALATAHPRSVYLAKARKLAGG